MMKIWLSMAVIMILAGLACLLWALFGLDWSEAKTVVTLMGGYLLGAGSVGCVAILVIHINNTNVRLGIINYIAELKGETDAKR